MERCTLCGGKVRSDGRCSECGLDNLKNDRKYHLNVTNDRKDQKIQAAATAREWKMPGLQEESKKKRSRKIKKRQKTGTVKKNQNTGALKKLILGMLGWGALATILNMLLGD